MAAITILKRATGKNHLVSVDEAADQIATSGLVRTAAGTANIYTDAFTTSITIGSVGVPVTIPGLVTNDENHIIMQRVFSGD